MDDYSTRMAGDLPARDWVPDNGSLALVGGWRCVGSPSFSARTLMVFSMMMTTTQNSRWYFPAQLFFRSCSRKSYLCIITVLGVMLSGYACLALSSSLLVRHASLTFTTSVYQRLCLWMDQRHKTGEALWTFNHLENSVIRFLVDLRWFDRWCLSTSLGFQRNFISRIAEFQRSDGNAIGSTEYNH